jgi:hypothetical protein
MGEAAVFENVPSHESIVDRKRAGVNVSDGINQADNPSCAA